MRHEISVSEFSSVIREFASYKSVIQGCSQRTVEQYLIDLRTFSAISSARETLRCFTIPKSSAPFR